MGSTHGNTIGRPNWLLATSASMSAIFAATLALELGGPGSLIWLWIATLLGFGLHVGEVVLRGPTHAPRHPWPSLAVGGTAGKILGTTYTIVAFALAVIVGGLLQAQQGSAVFETIMHRRSVGVPWALGLAGLALSWIPAAHTLAVNVVLPSIIGLYVAVAAGIALSEPAQLQAFFVTALDQAWTMPSATGGLAGTGFGVALHHGVMRAVLAGNLGLGVAAVTAPPHPHVRRRLALPLVAASAIATATMLLVGIPELRDDPITDGELVPLERPLNAGLRPSRRLGQTIVMPRDAPVEAGKTYAMRFRSDPRGHRLARFDPEENAVFVPAWTITEDSDTVVFRARDARGDQGTSWDVHVPCTRERIQIGDAPVLKLTPRDPAVNFKTLIAYYELGPTSYVVASDFTFHGHVDQDTGTDAGVGPHLAMYESPGGDRKPNPSLAEVVRKGFRGPYPEGSGPRPPWAWVAGPTFQAEIGTTVQLRMRANPRGDAVVRLNRVGGAEAPPWDILMGVTTFVIRHDDDPQRDIRIPVRVKRDGWRIRFKPDDPAWTDFRRIAAMTGFSGPYAVVDDQYYNARVHSDARLPPMFSGRQALVPLDASMTPMAPHGSAGTVPYRPHPAELLAFGMTGPLVDASPVRAVAQRLVTAAGTTNAGVALIIIAMVWIVISIAAWSEFAARVVSCALGSRFGSRFESWPGGLARLGVPVAAMAVPLIDDPSLLRGLHAVVPAVLVVVLTTLVWGLAQRKHRPPTSR